MTIEERAKVAALCRKLFPTMIPSNTKRWNLKLWETYHALIEVGLL